MKKRTTLIIGIISVVIGVLGWQLTSFSQEASPFEKECGSNSCCIAYNTGLKSMKNAWEENMIQALDQEKATSDKIDDAFEGYNTYKCWSEYLCKAVQFSEYGDPKNALTGLTKKHIGTIPGCQDPEDLEVPDTWDVFANILRNEWQFFVDTMNAGDANLKIDINLAPSLFTSNALPFIPQCMESKTTLNKSAKINSNMGDNYANCMEVFESRFGCGEKENCTSPNIALVKLESSLKKDNAKQKSGALENKLVSIIKKMHSMQLQTEYLKTNMQKLDELYSCYPSKCD